MTRVTGEWLTSSATQLVFDALDRNGAEVFVVGGCVRNALLGVPVSDIDMATSAHPDETMAAAEAAGLRVIPTGIDHGTVTIVADGVPYEVTTFRHDVSTDGRRATVSFADNAEQDAHRRDFTINALYANRAGLVTDYVGGLADIASRRLRFIDDPEKRIREDYLRILRYFRFFALYGDPSKGLDPDALSAVAANLDGLAKVSRERVTAETLKLFGAPEPAMAVAAMVQTGVAATLYSSGELATLQRFLHWETELGLTPDGIMRLSAFGTVDGLRLSKAQKKKFDAVRAAASGSDTVSARAYSHDLETALYSEALRAAMLETRPDTTAYEDAKRGAMAQFPLTSKDLMPAFSGAALGEELRRLEAIWIASDFTLSRAGLLQDD